MSRKIGVLHKIFLDTFPEQRKYVYAFPEVSTLHEVYVPQHRILAEMIFRGHLAGTSLVSFIESHLIADEASLAERDITLDQSIFAVKFLSIKSVDPVLPVLNAGTCHMNSRE